MPVPEVVNLADSVTKLLDAKKSAKAEESSASSVFADKARQYLTAELSLVMDAIPTVKYTKLAKTDKDALEAALTSFQNSLDQEFKKFSNAGNNVSVQNLISANQTARLGLRNALERLGDPAKNGSEPLKLLSAAYTTANLVALSAPLTNGGGGPNPNPPVDPNIEKANRFGAAIGKATTEHRALTVKLATNAKADEANRSALAEEYRAKEAFIYREILSETKPEDFQKIDEYRKKLKPSSNPNTQSDVAAALEKLNAAEGSKNVEDIRNASKEARKLFKDLQEVPSSLHGNSSAVGLSTLYASLKSEATAEQRAKERDEAGGGSGNPSTKKVSYKFTGNQAFDDTQIWLLDNGFGKLRPNGTVENLTDKDLPKQAVQTLRGELAVMYGVIPQHEWAQRKDYLKKGDKGLFYAITFGDNVGTYPHNPGMVNNARSKRNEYLNVKKMLDDTERDINAGARTGPKEPESASAGHDARVKNQIDKVANAYTRMRELFYQQTSIR